MRSIYIVFATSLFLSTGCDNATSTNSETKTTAPAPKAPAKSKLSDDGTARLMNVVSKYYGLKNALVATKAEQAVSAATQLATEADSFYAFLQADSVNSASLKPYLDTIAKQSRYLSVAKDDESCEKLRQHFEIISGAIYNMLKNVDLKNGGVYHQYCPMAFNDKGAFWISDENDIKNPYFGKKMLECGETTDSL